MSAIGDKYAALGGATGFLGSPTIPERNAPDGEGRYRHYDGGSIYWHPGTGAHEVHGAIRNRWEAMVWEAGTLGYPVTDELATPDGKGRFNHFQHGSIYWHPGTGAHDLQGRLRERWAMFGWETGFLGYPLTDHAIDHVGLARQRFQGGWISWDTATDTLRVVRCPALSPNYVLPIYAVRATDKDGGRPAAITANQIRQWLDRANRVMEVAGIELAWDGEVHPLADTDVNSVTGVDWPAWKSVKKTVNALAAKHAAMVIVFRHGPDPTPTGGGFSWWDYDFVVMPGFAKTHVAGVQNIGLMPHEVGHYLGLPHTFGAEFDTVADARDDLVNRNFVPDGYDGDRDIVADTPPCPHVRELSDRWAIESVELGGTTFGLPRDNVMAYYHPDASLSPRTLSPQQAERARSMVRDRRERGSLAAVERWGSQAEVQEYGRTYNALRARYDELWPQGWRLELLRPYVTDGNVRYSAVWRHGPVPERQVYGWTYEDFRANYDELWPKGWRLHLLEPYVHRGQVRYSATWRRSRAAEVQVYGWSYQHLRARYDELWPQGWRLAILKPYVAGGGVRYSAVWRKSRAAEHQVYGWKPSSFRKRYDKLWKDGWRLHILEPYSHGNQLRITAAWRMKRGPELQVYESTYKDYRRDYDDLWTEGWRLAHLAPYVLGDNLRYAAVWRPQPADLEYSCGPASAGG